jgi:phosphatidylglycerol:prolipoprotein diacylglycerol transferase
MKPTLWRLPFELPGLGPLEIYSYFAFLVVGFSLAAFLVTRDARRQGLDANRIMDLNLWMVVFGIIGARALHLLADGHLHEYLALCLDPRAVEAVDARVVRCISDATCSLSKVATASGLVDYQCDPVRHVCYPPRDCLVALKVWRGGLAYYGGFLCATAFGLYYLHRHRLPRWKITDLAGYGIPLGLFFGRLGCYLNGCCFGRPTRSFLGAQFPGRGPAWRAQVDAGLIPATAPQALPVHPTQLYEALGCLGIFIVLYFWLRPRKRFDGQVFFMLLVLYAVLRSAIELLRADERGVLWSVLSTSQIISIPLFVVALWMLRRLGRAAPTATS